MFYLTTHSTHFYIRLYGIRYMVEDHSHSERGNPLLPLWANALPLSYVPLLSIVRSENTPIETHVHQSKYSRLVLSFAKGANCVDSFLNWQNNFYIGKNICEIFSFIFVYNFQLILFIVQVCTQFEVALHQMKWLPGQSSRCTVKFIRSKCDKGCDWCIYVTVVTCADTLTFTLCIQ